MIAASAGGLLAAAWYFLSLAPLFFTLGFFLLFLSMYPCFSYWRMMIWAGCFSFGSLLPIAQVIQDHAIGQARQLLFIALCTYLVALCAVSAWIIIRLRCIDWYFPSVSLPLMMTLFIYVGSGYALMPFGVPYGFPAINPLVPLIYHYSLLIYFIRINEWGTLLGILIIINLAAQACALKKWWCAGSALILIALICMPLPLPDASKQICQLATFIKPGDTHFFKSDDDAWDRAEKIAESVHHVPSGTVVCFPESAFPLPLNSYPAFIAWWDQVAPRESTVLIGAHRRSDTAIYNTLYHLKEGRIIQIYDKKECLPLVETELKLAYFLQGICQFFVSSKDRFCNATNERAIFSLNEYFSCMPLICSELICRTADPQPASVPILCVANDRWLSWPSARQTMALIARLRALTWQRTVIYCAYHHAFIAAADGSYLNQ